MTTGNQDSAATTPGPLTGFVPDEPFESYRKRFEEHVTMAREDGILEVQMHTGGREAVWSYELHRALPQLFSAIGADRENEVVILTGTGEKWLAGRDAESFRALDKETSSYHETIYDKWYIDGTNLQERILWAINIPIISVLNGPGFHTESALMCDLTIAADDTTIFEPHFFNGLVPGDGLFLVLQNLVGLKRANYLMYVMGAEGVTAEQALDLGLVNEIHARDHLLPRARELARILLKQDRIVRRMTAQITRRPWRRAFTDDFAMHYGHQIFAAAVSPVDHGEFDGKRLDHLRGSEQ